MTIIFFDLETSDKDPCGQILNYSFIRTDDKFQIEEELSGDIALSILQIPSPEALLTNRVKILDHQASNFLREPESMLAIARFLGDSIEHSKDSVYLTGYNSARFDLPFIRTSFIRNGINPYFSGKLKYSDILHLVRKAYLSHSEFPDTLSSSDPAKLSLSLEAVSKAFGLLGGPQSHHSREDVLLTIELAKILQNRFSLHPAKFYAYEAKKGEELFLASLPNYEKSADNQAHSVVRQLGLLNENYRAALWLDLQRFSAGEGRAAVSWYNKNAGQLTRGEDAPLGTELKQILEKAKAEFAGLTTDNFFPKSTCDIEQDIYRLDMQKIATLGQVIWGNERSNLDKIKDKDLQDLISRYWLAYGVSPEKRGQKWQEKLGIYAQYRYGGKSFQLQKSTPMPNENNEISSSAYHKTLAEIKSSIGQLLEQRKEPGDQEILRQLESYIVSGFVAGCLSQI